MLFQSERIAAMPMASCFRRSSQSFALPASSGYWRWNASKSGSPPSARSFSARLRSRIICRVRSSCSGDRPFSESRMFLKYEPRTCSCSCFSSSWYFSAAFGSTNS